MSPEFWTRVAVLFFPARWWLMAGSLSSFAVLAWLSLWNFTANTLLWFACIGPLTILPWALLCACLWFHPERGTLRDPDGWLRWFARPIRLALRWYAALLLGAICLLAGIAMPAFVLLA